MKDKAAATALEIAGGGKVSRPQFLKAKICLKIKPVRGCFGLLETGVLCF
jgi:hypothetical protein